MAAGLGYIEFTTGDVLTAASANGYLASQVVMVFASAAARTSAIASPQEGMISYLKDTNSTEYYSGSAWVAIGGAGGGMTLLSTTTLSGTSTNITSISQSYNQLLVIVKNMSLSATGSYPQIRPNGDAGNTAYISNIGRGNSTFAQADSAQTIVMAYSDYAASNGNNAFAINLYNYAATDSHKPFRLSGTFVTSSAGAVEALDVGGSYRSNTAISSLDFRTAGANTFNSGTVLIYGVK